ncbi:MAG: hypothetical protein ABR530_10860, partial [Pyrinomonadaceae bacterium]
VDGFDDEGFTKLSETTRFELKDGQFGNRGEGSRWMASEITDDSILFVPVVKAMNSFRWQKEAGGAWKAILDYPAIGDKPARQVVYKMEPVKK